jgi:hypothetical protein
LLFQIERKEARFKKKRKNYFIVGNPAAVLVPASARTSPGVMSNKKLL